MPSPSDPGVEVTIQADVPLPSGVTSARISSLVAHILADEGVSGPWTLGVHFIDDAHMQSAHEEFMDIDEPTDIMTFPYEDDEAFLIGEEGGNVMPSAGGDLMISVDRAAENAAEAGWSTEDELLFLIAHGMLHLLGWDDLEDDDRRSMLDRQRELLTSWRDFPAASD